MKKVCARVSLAIIILMVTSYTLLCDDNKDHIGKMGLGLDFNYYPGEVESEYFLGLHARLRFNEYVGLEAEIQFRSSSTQQTNLTIENSPLSFSLLYFLLPKSILCVYVFGGVTFTKPVAKSTDSPGPSEQEGEWQKGLHGGLGLEIPINESIVLHTEARYNDLSFSIIGMEVDYSGLSYSGGISFYF